MWCVNGIVLPELLVLKLDTLVQKLMGATELLIDIFREMRDKTCKPP
jgi:hypothetical protein